MTKVAKLSLEAIVKANDAHQRARPLARLLDYGMDFANASILLSRPWASEPWVLVASELARLRFDPDMNQINCPWLVIHGGANPLVKLEDQQPFISTRKKQSLLKVCPQRDHIIYNHVFERNTFASDSI